MMSARVSVSYMESVLDLNKFENLINWHIESGTSGIVVNGTTGESATLLPEERKQLLQLAIQTAKDKVAIIAGTGTNSTITTIQQTQEAEELGADAVLIVTPYYNKPTQSGLIAHYTEVAKNTSLPIILYNVPSRTGCDLLPETVCELSQIENIVGIKEATGDLSRVQKIKSGAAPDFILLSGDDSTALEFIKLGGHGVISVTANIAPKEMQKLCVQKSETDFLADLHPALMVQSNPIPVKWALWRMGKIDLGIRLPLLPLEKSYQQQLEEVLRQTMILEDVSCAT